MKPELEKLCTEFTASRDAVKAAFRWDNKVLHSVCANIFCANGRTADTDRLKECRGVIKSRTKLFSDFRKGRIRPLLASMLALGEKPEDRMDLANEYYSLLKRNFKKSEFLVLAAILLTDLQGKTLTEETAARGKELFRRMNKQHRILTNKADSVFSMLLAFSEKTDDELLEDVEACYRALKARFSSSGDAQTAAQILSVAPGAPEEKAKRVIELYDALLEAKVKYGRARELAPLAALSLADTAVPVLVEEIREADEFLGTGKYYGSKDEELNQRAMHAVMIVSDQYAGTDSVNATVMTNTLEMLISQQQAARVSMFIHGLEFLGQILSGFSKHDKKDADTAADTDSSGSQSTDTDTAGKPE